MVFRVVFPSSSGHHHSRKKSASSTDSSLYAAPRVPTRTLHIYKHGVTHEQLTIKDDDKCTPLYTVTGHADTRGMELFRCSRFVDRAIRATYPAGSLVGTSHFEIDTRKIILCVSDRSLEMVPLDPKGENFHFESSRGGFLRWERGQDGKHLVCVAEWMTGSWIAEVDLRSLKVYKEGKLKLCGYNLEQYLLDEIVLSGLAMIEQYKERHIHE